MDDERLISDITTLRCSIEEHGRRILKLEAVTENIQQLTVNVEKLALTMQTMLVEQQKFGARLEALEKEPADRAKDVRKAVITTLIGGIIGAILTKVLTIIL